MIIVVSSLIDLGKGIGLFYTKDLDQEKKNIEKYNPGAEIENILVGGNENDLKMFQKYFRASWKRDTPWFIQTPEMERLWATCGDDILKVRRLLENRGTGWVSIEEAKRKLRMVTDTLVEVLWDDDPKRLALHYQDYYYFLDLFSKEEKFRKEDDLWPWIETKYGEEIARKIKTRLEQKKEDQRQHEKEIDEFLSGYSKAFNKYEYVAKEERDPWLLEAVPDKDIKFAILTIGRDKMKEFKYEKRRVLKEVDIFGFDESGMREEIKSKFKAGDIVSRKEVKNILANIYYQFGYHKAAKSIDLLDWLEEAEMTSDHNSYKIIKP